MTESLPVVTLQPRPPFDILPILGYYGRSPLEPLDVVSEGTWRRAVRLGGQPVLFDVASTGTPAEPSLTVRVLAGAAPPPSPLQHPTTGPRYPHSITMERGSTDEPLPLSIALGRDVGARPREHRPSDDGAADVRAAQRPEGGTLSLAAEAVTRWWRLDQDPAELDPIAARDPVLGELLARLHGARAPLMPSPFECLVWAILGQQITVAFAYKMKRALVERYGESVEYEGRTYWLFPDAARLAEADPAELRELQFSRQKSDYVRSLATLVAADRIDWAGLAALPSDEAIKGLTALRGVGRWTAEYVLMRGLGHEDVIPAADVGLQAAIGRAYGLGRKATEPEVRGLAEQWAPRRSHAAFAWWWSLSASRGLQAPPP